MINQMCHVVAWHSVVDLHFQPQILLFAFYTYWFVDCTRIWIQAKTWCVLNLQETNGSLLRQLFGHPGGFRPRMVPILNRARWVAQMEAFPSGDQFLPWAYAPLPPIPTSTPAGPTTQLSTPLFSLREVTELIERVHRPVTSYERRCR